MPALSSDNSVEPSPGGLALIESGDLDHECLGACKPGHFGIGSIPSTVNPRSRKGSSEISVPIPTSRIERPGICSTMTAMRGPGSGGERGHSVRHQRRSTLRVRGVDAQHPRRACSVGIDGPCAHSRCRVPIRNKTEPECTRARRLTLPTPAHTLPTPKNNDHPDDP